MCRFAGLPCLSLCRHTDCPQYATLPLFSVLTAQAWSRAEPGDRDRKAEPSSVPDSLPVAGAETDWREFRARLILSQTGSNKASQLEPGHSGRPSVDAGYWAHPIPNPEQGCLLIAHPLMFLQSQRYFHEVRCCKTVSSLLLQQHQLLPLTAKISLRSLSSAARLLNQATDWQLDWSCAAAMLSSRLS